MVFAVGCAGRGSYALGERGVVGRCIRLSDIPHLPFQLVGPGSHSLCGVGAFYSQFHIAKLGSGYEKGSIFSAEIMDCRFLT